MPEAQLYPGARWTPLGAQTETRMRAHDILCLHTMVGYLSSTDPYFRITNGIGFAGTESHYGVGGKWGGDIGGDLDGATYQWQDRAFTADANLDGNYRVISIETADNAPKLPQDIEAWTAKQVEAIAQILAWESPPAAHAACPSTWACHRDGIPLVLVPDSKPGRRGVAYHRQGIDPWRVAGGEKWSSTDGKPCPTDRRIAQIPEVINRARAIVAGGEEDEMSEADVAAIRGDIQVARGKIEATFNKANAAAVYALEAARLAGVSTQVIKLADNDAQFALIGGTLVWLRDQDDVDAWGLRGVPYQTIPTDDSRWSTRLEGPVPPDFPTGVLNLDGGQ